jgi:hypothetical protein
MYWVPRVSHSVHKEKSGDFSIPHRIKEREGKRERKREKEEERER